MLLKFKELDGKRRQAAIMLLCLILATVGFIFIQSMLSPGVSGAESGAVRRFLEKFFSYDRPIGAFLLNNLRKVAHFVEYGVLGLEISLYVSLFSRDFVRLAPYTALVGHGVAFIDETIQIFSGRGPAILDVWIDTLGFVSASFILYLIAFILREKHLKKEIENG
jgi:VanZ family protein